MLSDTMWPHSSYSSTGVFIRLLFDEIFCKESQLLHIRYGKCRKYPKFQINKEIRLQISFSSVQCTYVDASIITKCHVVKLSGCHHSQSVTWPRAQRMGGTVELILEFLFQSDLNSLYVHKYRHTMVITKGMELSQSIWLSLSGCSKKG